MVLPALAGQVITYILSRYEVMLVPTFRLLETNKDSPRNSVLSFHGSSKNSANGLPAK